jgi:hypothetical protein
MTRQGEHEGHRQLGNAHAVRTRRVHDDDAACAGGVDVDVVDTGAGAGDGAKPRRGLDQRGSDFGGASNDQRVSGLEIIGQGVRSPARSGVDLPALGAEEVDRGCRKIVGNNYSHRSAVYTCRLANASRGVSRYR